MELVERKHAVPPVATGLLLHKKCYGARVYNVSAGSELHVECARESSFSPPSDNTPISAV